MSEEHKSYQVPIEELVDGAIKHYSRVTYGKEWYSIIPTALKFYRDNYPHINEKSTVDMTAEERVCEQIREMFGDMDDRLEQAIIAYGRHKFESGTQVKLDSDTYKAYKKGLKEGFEDGAKSQRKADVKRMKERFVGLNIHAQLNLFPLITEKEDE